MKSLFLALAAFSFATTALFAQSKKELRADIDRLNSEIAELKKEYEVDFDNEVEKASYALGMVVSSNMEAQGLEDLSLEALQAGIKDALLKKSLKLEREEAELVLREYMEKAYEAKIEKMRTESADFLEKNAARDGVIETASGLQYEIKVKGNGKTPSPEDRVTVHYVGKLVDGTVFDSSLDRGEPITFGTSQVIPGWTEALQLMQEGDQWTLYIPYDLAYGERGAGNQIPPFATLIFEVELISVESGQ